MRTTSWIRWTMRLAAAVSGGVVGGYAAYAAVTWARYGHVSRHGREDLLDRFMPEFEVVERHHIRVAAPAATVLAAARELNLLQHPLVRAIVKTREIALGARADDRPRRDGLLAEMRALGWGVLVDRPGSEVVMGAVTKPWEPNVTFRSVPPEAFAAFSEPGLVKIAWTLRVDRIDDGTTVFRTETRALATDANARARFRRYWPFVSPGIAVIRWVSLGMVKHEAERRARLARANPA